MAVKVEYIDEANNIIINSWMRERTDILLPQPGDVITVADSDTQYLIRSRVYVMRTNHGYLSKIVILIEPL